MATRRKTLRHEAKLIDEDRNRLHEENKELKKTIKLLTEGSERFSMLDL